ncbi:YaaR family protein [Neobacillus rhizophilus]|uniref:YaaR family protein n=1 Tax=Neobacillus rhizophilus TaxID=2833579 RepID=A0A942U1T3_9BACI|nr:YaaR family protein [Neobacillus rhizophilus]MBS4213021.1 YaaR family protein [Neobacillus rhizophilus]
MKVSPGFGVTNDKMFFQKETKQAESSSFQQILTDSKTNLVKEQLSSLLDGIQKQGERLVQSRTAADLQKYKKLIQSFLQEVVKNGLSLEITDSFTAMNRGRRLKIIKEIDRNLLELSKKILEKEDANIQLLDKIGEIKGLLIDLYL